MLFWFAKRLREMQEVKRDERGFTLIELLVVIIIIGILAAIAIPVFLSQRDKARQQLVNSDARNAGTAAATCLVENNQGLCDTVAELEAFGYKPATAATQAVATSGGADVKITSTHKDNTAIKAAFDTATGNLATS